MAKIGKVQEVSIADIKPYENNAKLHGGNQVDLIAKSIEEFGFLNPCLIDKEKNLIAGHGRVMAAKQLGFTKVPCLYVEGLTDDQRRAYILADNKLTELGEWDLNLVSAELEALKANGFDIDLTGFDIDDIIIDDDMGTDLGDYELDEDDEVIVPRIKPGEIWKLGNHRLMCGDSTKAEDVQKLMDGELADLVITDPPYNVDIGGKNEMMAKAGYQKKPKGIENDNMGAEEFYGFLDKVFRNAYNAMKEGAPFYVWYASINADAFFDAIKKNGLKISQQLIWVKNTMAFGMSDYQWRHEPCIYGWKEGKAHYFIDLRSLTTIFENDKELTYEELKEFYNAVLDTTTTLYEKKPAKSDLHPTMKPVNLIKKQIRNSSSGGGVRTGLVRRFGNNLNSLRGNGAKVLHDGIRSKIRRSYNASLGRTDWPCCSEG